MKTTFGQRLQAFISYRDLTYAKFGAAFSATKQEVSNWVNGTKMPFNRLSDLSIAYPDLNLYWLLNEEGEMLRSGKDTGSASSAEEGRAIYNQNVDWLHEKIELLEEIKRLNKKLEERQSDNQEADD